MIDRLVPSNKKLYAARELLASNEELAKPVLRRMVLV